MFATLIIENKAHVFEVAHIEPGDYFEDNAIEYMVQRMGLENGAAVDGWMFSASLEELIAWAADLRITIA